VSGNAESSSILVYPAYDFELQETNTKQCNLTQACSRRSSAEETREVSCSFYGILSVNDEHW